MVCFVLFDNFIIFLFFFLICCIHPDQRMSYINTGDKFIFNYLTVHLLLIIDRLKINFKFIYCLQSTLMVMFKFDSFLTYYCHVSERYLDLSFMILLFVFAVAMFFFFFSFPVAGPEVLCWAVGGWVVCG